MPNKTVLIVFGLLLALISPSASAGMNSNDSNRYPASLSEGIDFSRPGYPDFIAEVSGLSSYEKTHRWTDALEAPSARFRFKEPLPERFVLEIEADAFGPNGSQPTVIKLDQSTATVYFLAHDTKTHYVELTNPGGADTLEIIPPQPTSPLAFDRSSGDTRKLGIALKRIAIRDPFRIKAFRYLKDGQAIIEFWYLRAVEATKNLKLVRLKLVTLEYLKRMLRWIGW